MVAVMRTRAPTSAGGTLPRSAGTPQGSSSSGGSRPRNAMLSNLIRGIKVPTATRASQQDIQSYIDQMVKKISPEQMRKVTRNLFIQMSSPLAQMRFKEEYPSAVAQFSRDPTNYGLIFADCVVV